MVCPIIDAGGAQWRVSNGLAPHAISEAHGCHREIAFMPAV
jgi:hypothetical protein